MKLKTRARARFRRWREFRVWNWFDTVKGLREWVHSLNRPHAWTQSLTEGLES